MLGLREGNDLVIYIDGIKSGTYTHNVISTINVSSTAMFRIAAGNRTPSGGAYWNGTIDSIRIYNKALTPDETVILNVR